MVKLSMQCELAFHVAKHVCGSESLFSIGTKETKWGSALLRGNISSITTRNKAVFRWAYYIVQAAWLQLLARKYWVLYSNWSKTRSTHSPMALKRLLTCTGILANVVLPPNPQHQCSYYRKYLLT